MYKKKVCIMLVFFIVFQYFSTMFFANAMTEEKPQLINTNPKTSSVLDTIYADKMSPESSSVGQTIYHDSDSKRVESNKTLSIAEGVYNSSITRSTYQNLSGIVTIAADTTPPTTSIVVNGTLAGNGVYYGMVTIQLTAVDSESGVNRTEYSLDGGTTWIIYAGNITLLDPKIYTFKYRSIDNSNNIETAKTQKITIKSDTTPPVTTVSISGNMGNNGYYIGLVSIVLSAKDDFSGVQTTEYSLDDGITWGMYTSPISLSEDKVHRISYRSTDKSGNIETVKVTKLAIDSTPPALPKIIMDPSDWINGDVLVTLLDGQDNISGAYKTQYKLGSTGAWVDYSVPFSVSTPNQEMLYARTIDFAGNISSEASSLVKIDRIPPDSPVINLSENNWTNTDVIFSIIHGNDNDSKAKISEYKIGPNGNWTVFTSPVTISDEGITDITAHTIDFANNISAETNKQIKIDRTVPSTPIINPSTLDWTNKDVTFTISNIVDTLSGVQKVQYKINTNGTWEDYSSTVTVSSEGIIPIFARTIDRAGNISEEASAIVKIDKTSPSQPRINASTLDWAQEVEITINSGTDLLSGVMKTEFKFLENGEWLEYTEGAIITFQHEGINNIYARTIDIAGNISTEAKLTMKIDRTPPTIPNNLRYTLKTKSGIYLAWDASTDNVGIRGYEIYNGEELIASAPNKTTYFLDNLKENKYYNLHIRAKDLAGNLSEVSNSITVLTNDPISTSKAHNVFMDNDGSVWDWGNEQSIPAKVKNANGHAMAVAAGASHGLFLNNDGTVWAWGANDLGQLGIGSHQGYYFRDNPVQVNGLESIIAISASDDTSMALKNDGTVYFWGRGPWDNKPAQLLPQKIDQFTSIVGIAAGFSQLIALKDDGTVWEVGFYFDNYGRQDFEKYSPDGRLLKLSNVESVSSGSSHSFAELADGTAWGWGNNADLQIRYGDPRPNTIIVAQLDWISTLYGKIKSISAGGDLSIAQLEDKTAIIWGKYKTANNVWLGPISNTNNVTNLSSVAAVAASGSHFLVLKEDGSLWTWGFNNAGQLGNGTRIDNFTPSVVVFDKSVPSAPDLKIVTKTESSVTLSWGPSQDGTSGIKEYVIYKDGVNIATTTSTQYTVANLAIGNKYKFYVIAKNNLNLESTISNVIEAEIVDVTPPTAPANLAVLDKSDSTVKLGWDQATDNTGVVSYQVFIDQTLIGTTENTNYTVEKLNRGTIYQFYVKAVDAAGNESPVSNQTSGKTELLINGSFEKETIAGFADGWSINASGQAGYTTDVVELSAVTGLKVQKINISDFANGEHVAVTQSNVPVTPKRMFVFKGFMSVPGLSNTIVEIKVELFDTLNQKISEFIVTESTINTAFKLFEVQGLVPDNAVNASVSAGLKSISTNGSGELLLDAAQFVITDHELTSKEQLVTGEIHNLLLKEDGNLWVWGDNSKGQLGDGTTNNKTTGLKLSSISNIAMVAAGSYHSLALRKDGTVWAWGNNANGQLGNGTLSGSNVPIQVPGLTGVISIGAGYGHSIAVKADGTVWTWGKNDSGQLGDGTKVDRLSPVQVPNLTGVAAVTGGVNYTAALKSDGTVWSWGGNQYGQLGNNNSNVPSLIPVQATNLSGVISIAAGLGHTLALKGDGTVWGWGYNYDGQVGNGSNSNRYSPTQVLNVNNIKSIGIGLYFGYAVKNDGTVWVWGDAFNGKLGTGNLREYTPVQSPPLSSVKMVAQGKANDYTLSMKQDGTVWGMGLNRSGQLGDGTTTAANAVPVMMQQNVAPKVSIASPLGTQNSPATINVSKPPIGWKQVDSELTTFKAYQVQILDETGAAIIMDSGILPQDTTADSGSWQVSDALPVGQKLQIRVKVSDGAAWSDWSVSSYMVIQQDLVIKPMIVTGEIHNLLLKEDGNLWVWGDNSKGQLGDGTTNNKTTGLKLSSISNIAMVAAGSYHSLALRKDGTVWAWGNNANGQLGNGTLSGSNVPIQVPGLTGVISIGAGYGHSIAVKADGTVWTWGKNDSGQLGDGTKVDRLSPVQVPNLTGVAAVTGGVNYTAALKSDGTVWSWGGNQYGQLGNNNSNVPSLIPVQATNLSGVISIAAGLGHTLALKGDGTVWGWGYNYDGQVGNGSNSNRYSPTQVLNVNNIKSIGIGLYFGYAVKNDGTVWVWGDAFNGKLGTGNLREYTPVQSPPLSSVKMVAQGKANDYTLSMKQDGTVWGMGLNRSGQLGDGTTTAANAVPVKTILNP
ncbi:fibronectin type III domain-containing protein [Paenibacillus sp. 32352]|uniref:RCC1 domain-containing protein n=1 Tax=Paenibacillus sp. 32352 TaxID=1969111 RepID=UPI0015C4DC0C|nr:fibronectin type III domain-containing protein [Paenibacillus sp. 32352]